ARRARRVTGLLTLLVALGAGLLGLAVIIGGVAVALWRIRTAPSTAPATAPVARLRAGGAVTQAAAAAAPRGNGVLRDEAPRAKWSVRSGAADGVAELPTTIEVEGMNDFWILNPAGDFIGTDNRGVVRGRINKEGHPEGLTWLEAAADPLFGTAAMSRDGSLAMGVKR